MGCCNNTNIYINNKKTLCPLCNNIGQNVHYLVLKETVKADVISQVNEETYFVCRNNECDVVFYNKYGDRIFLTQDINMKSNFTEVTKNKEEGCNCKNESNCNSCKKRV